MPSMMKRLCVSRRREINDRVTYSVTKHQAVRQKHQVEGPIRHPHTPKYVLLTVPGWNISNNQRGFPCECLNTASNAGCFKMSAATCFSCLWGIVVFIWTRCCCLWAGILRIQARGNLERILTQLKWWAGFGSILHPCNHIGIWHCAQHIPLCHTCLCHLSIPHQRNVKTKTSQKAGLVESM